MISDQTPNYNMHANSTVVAGTYHETSLCRVRFANEEWVCEEAVNLGTLDILR